MRQKAIPENLNDRWPTAGRGTARFPAQNARQGLPENPKTDGYHQQSSNSSDRKQSNISLTSRQPSKATPAEKLKSP